MYRAVGLAFLLALAPTVALSQDDGGCEFGLVLSGGGARGIAHIGVLEVFEQEGIVPDCVVGASMGSVVGALYAAGHDTDAIVDLMSALSWKTLYTEPANRAAQPILHRLESQQTVLRIGFGDTGLRFPRSVLNDSMVNRLLIQTLAPANFRAGRDFGALPIPFRTVGTDLKSGDRVVLHEGDLARAVRASMSVPLAYSPLEWGDTLLIDGGLVDNVPVSLAHEMGARYTIAIDVSTPIEAEVQADLLGVTKRIVDLLYAAKNQQYAVEPDLLIRPELNGHSFANYSGFEKMIAAGREAARAALGKIPVRYRGRSRAHPEEADIGPRRVAGVEVAGHRYVSPELLARELGVEPGDRLDFQHALDGLDRVYSTGLIQNAWVDIRPADEDAVTVSLQVVEENRHTADVGLAYQSDDQVQGFLRVETRNPFGGGERVRLTTYASARDTLLSLGVRNAHLFGAHLGYNVAFEFHDEKPKAFEASGEFINRTEFRRRHVKLLFDLPFGTRHLLEAGFRFGSVKVQERLGLPYPTETQNRRVLIGRYVWDDLDSLVLPQRGRFVRVLAEHNLEAFGAEVEYTLVDVYARGARHMGPLFVEGRIRYGYGSKHLPVSEQFRIGGPELVPGLSRDERWGTQALAGSLSVGVEVLSLLRLYGRVGIGNVWDRPRDITWRSAIGGVGFGATLATPLGPAQIDYGWAEGGRNRFTLSLGWQSQGIRDTSGPW